MIKYAMFLLLTCGAGAAAAEAYPAGVEAALAKAGDNRPQLEAALEHFRASGDRQKLEAAYFLVQNMPGHYYSAYALKDSSGNAVAFDPLAYPDYAAMLKAWDAADAAHGGMNWRSAARYEDISTMTAAAFITNVDLAFKAWREKPWAAGVPLGDFLEYILPYRGSNEPVEQWRAYFLEKYKDLPARMQDPRDPKEAAALINSDIKTWFRFDAIFYKHPEDQGLAEMLRRGAGRCEDMTNLAIFALRANAVPVAGDYTPHWADTGNNHAWNALVLPDGRSVPFMGAMENPGVYRLSNKPAKAYRKTFGRNPAALAALAPPGEALPGWFKGTDYTDVTSAYAAVTGDIEVAVPPPPPGASVPYLAVFNSGKWEIIGWGERAGGKARFKNFAAGVAYLPVCYSSGTVAPAGTPFIYNSSGAVEALPADGPPVKVELRSTTQKVIAHATENVLRSNLDPARVYELYYWSAGAWKLHGKARPSDGALAFPGAPGRALFWLKAEGSKGEERIFTFPKGSQSWW